MIGDLILTAVAGLILVIFTKVTIHYCWDPQPFITAMEKKAVAILRRKED